MNVTMRQAALFVAALVAFPAAALAQGPGSQLSSPLVIIVPAPAQQAPAPQQPAPQPSYVPAPQQPPVYVVPAPQQPAPQPSYVPAPQQQPVYIVPAPSQPVLVEPPTVALGSPSAWAEPPAEQHRGVSFGRSFGHAWAGWGIGVGVGALGGGLIAGATCGSSDWCLVNVIAGASLGALATAPLAAGLATWGFGDLRGGTGNAFASIGGAYLGTGVGIGLTYLLSQLGTAGGVVGAVVTVVLTNLGATLGYQLTQHGTRAPDAPRAELTVVPTITTPEHGDGVVVGAAGMF